MSDKADVLYFPLGTWVVCAECNRAYRVGDFRSECFEDPADNFVIQVSRCPYSNCEGYYGLDSIPWEQYRLGTSFPTVPHRDVVYVNPAPVQFSPHFSHLRFDGKSSGLVAIVR